MTGMSAPPQGGWSGPYWEQEHTYTPPPSQAVAGWALGLSLVPFGITQVAALMLAVITLRRSRDGREHGRGMALAAMAISVLWVLAIGALWALIFLIPAERGEDGAVTSPGEVDVFEMAVGDCLDAPDSGTHFSVSAVPCSEPHEAEVYASFDLAGDEYPGDEQVEEAADAGCLQRFRPFTGPAYEDSELELSTMVPTRESWEFEDDREIACTVVLPGNATTTGSLRNSNR